LTGTDPEPANIQAETAAPVAPTTTSVDQSSIQTRRLTDEVQQLRQNLEQFHQRDRAMYQIVPGRALQIVMTMVPPGEPAADALASTAMLGDALAAISQGTYSTPIENENVIPPEELSGEWASGNPDPSPRPEAVPIYDAARDTGTLVVKNLPPPPHGMLYHLWVSTSASNLPVFLGSLPEDIVSGAVSFDFGLDTTMILPTAFMLTLGTADSPTPPNEKNTVLSGPPSVDAPAPANDE
jgi:hypothetical protein